MLERTLEGDPFLIRQGSDMEARSDRLSGGWGGAAGAGFMQRGQDRTALRVKPYHHRLG